MTIHASGTPIKASEIFSEINVTTGPMSFTAHDQALRELALVYSGPVMFSDFYSKSTFANLLAENNSFTFSRSVAGYSAISIVINSYNFNSGNGPDYSYFHGITTISNKYFIFALGPINVLRNITPRQVKLRKISGPTGGGGSPTITFDKTISGSSSAYTENTWTDLPSGAGPFDIIRVSFDFSAATGTVVYVAEIGVRLGSNATTEAVSTITITSQA